MEKGNPNPQKKPRPTEQHLKQSSLTGNSLKITVLEQAGWKRHTPVEVWGWDVESFLRYRRQRLLEPRFICKQRRQVLELNNAFAISFLLSERNTRVSESKIVCLFVFARGGRYWKISPARIIPSFLSTCMSPL